MARSQPKEATAVEAAAADIVDAVDPDLPDDDAPIEVDGEAVEIVRPGVAIEVARETAPVEWSEPAIAGRDEFLSIAMQARIMASSALVPRALQGKPHDVFLVLLTGRDVGIPTTAALRMVHVIEGTPTLAPKLRIALINRSGAGKIKPHPENGPTWAAAVAYGPDGQVLGPPVIYTWAMAQTAGLVRTDCEPDRHSEACRKQWGQKGGSSCKANYRTYPHRMLWWRAAGYAADDYFPEIGMGLYSPDELGAITDEDGVPLDPATVDVPAGYSGPERAPDTDDDTAPDEAIAEICERIAALPEDVKAGDGGMREKWKADDLLQRFTPRNLSNRAMRRARALVSGFESKARGQGWDQQAALAAVRAGTPAGEEGHTPPGAAETGSGGDPAPDGEIGPEAPAGAGSGDVDDERAAAIIDHVRGLDDEAVAAGLVEAGIKAEGAKNARRQTLALHLFRGGFDPRASA